MKISKDCAVTLHYKVANTQGKVLEQSQEPIAYLHGGYGNIFPAVEEALQDQEAGFRASLDLTAAQAFGERDEALLQSIPKSEFPPGVKVGGQLEGRDANGNARAFTVLKIKGDQVFLDGNQCLGTIWIKFFVMKYHLS